MGVAIGAMGLQQSVIDNALSIASFVMGILLGPVSPGDLDEGRRRALGVRRDGRRDFSLVTFVKFATTIAYPWWALIGSSTVYLVAVAVNPLIPTTQTEAGFRCHESSRDCSSRRLVGCLVLLFGSRVEAGLTRWPQPADVGLDPRADSRGSTTPSAAPSRARQFPGAVVVVGRDGKIAFARRLMGIVRSSRRVEPMTRDTIFDMASLDQAHRDGHLGDDSHRTEARFALQ